MAFVSRKKIQTNVLGPFTTKVAAEKNALVALKVRILAWPVD